MFADKITLTMQETLLVAVAGIIVVMLELALITVIILGISRAMRSLEGRIKTVESEISETPEATVSVKPVAVPPVSAPAAAYASSSVQLIDVDEPTAAVVMALVSKESGIPLERLKFKSIKGITELVGVDERTAATIMAIVSKESDIPLERLSFKSIKKVEE